MKQLQSGLFAALLVSTSAYAQAPSKEPDGQRSAATTSSPADTSMATGVVRKVDRDAQKVTMRHGPIANLDMPEMTMVFRVADPKMLEGLAPAKKVRFRAERINGQLTVTFIESAS